MINLLARQFHAAAGVVSCLMAVVLLVGCGAERTTPYNPAVTGSSSSSSAVAVSTSVITQANQTTSVIDHTDKRLQVIREQGDFYNISDAYVNFNPSPPDFTTGQVVLLDLGVQDSCKQHLDFNSIRAEQAGNNSVKLVVSYQERAAITTGCTSVTIRPFYFYYVGSRGTLIVEENLL